MTPWTGGLPACGGQGARGGLQAIKDARWRKATGLVAAGGQKALRLYAAEKGAVADEEKNDNIARGNGLCPPRPPGGAGSRGSPPGPPGPADCPPFGAGRGRAMGCKQ